MKKTLQKVIALILVSLLLIGQRSVVVAQTAPTPPTAPTAPSAPPPPPPPESEPTPPEAPTAPTAPTPPSESDPTNEPEAQPTEEPSQPSETTQTPEETNTQEEQASSQTEQNTNEQPVSDGNQTGFAEANGQVGDPSITTGDATNTAGVAVSANNNSAFTPTDGTSIGVVNEGNGTDSTNAGSVGVVDSNQTLQNNSATVTNSLDQTSTSGQNSTSGNVGSSSIDTGDANTSGTIISAVNTNVDGVAVSEFNVMDDHVGDLVLDFASGCILGCPGGDILVKNADNGSSSTNTGEVDSVANNYTFQANDASVENFMTLASDSGNNTADANTGGDSEIDTGNANVSANVLNFANNNLAGGVYYGVVNIYGDLTGDIIFPEEYLAGCCVSDVLAANLGNGTESNNAATTNQNSNDSTFQTNAADIDNILTFDTTTGDNSTSANTGGDNEITTGNAAIDANVLNIANTNIDGGVWWLVLVNEAGNWIGRILGSDPNANYAGSPGTEFQVDPNGEISVVNNSNGAGSTNTGTVNQTTNDTTVQNNDAHIVNNVNLSANTGGNSASNNTNGNNSIDTGDASIVANIVNFVNNNFTGGKLFVTVVNVFGSWVGDFVGPGQKQEKDLAAQADNEPAIGGADIQNPPSNGSTGNQSSNSTSQINTGEENNEHVSAPARVPHVFASLFGGGTGGSGTTLVLGQTTNENTNGGATVGGKKTISINLAWLLLLAACVILFFAAKKIARNIIRRRHTSALT